MTSFSNRKVIGQGQRSGSHEGTFNIRTGDKKCAAEMLKADVLLKMQQSWLWKSVVSLSPDSSNSQRAFTQFGKPKHAERMLGFSEVRKGALAIAILTGLKHTMLFRSENRIFSFCRPFCRRIYYAPFSTLA